MNWIWHGLYHAVAMAWETFWALVFGFGVSAALQTFISKEQMGHLFGRTTLRSMALATGLGAASSSCSYAAAAAARSAFKQGAAFIPALAFMFASTNLVIELGAVLWLLMGWHFVLAEVVGAFALIGLLWLLAILIFPRDLEEQARRHVDAEEEESECCHHGKDDHRHEAHTDRPPGQTNAAAAKWRQLADAFVMDWQMLWKEIATGFLIAGYLAALVPSNWWRALFLTDGPPWVRLLENAVVGPIIAVFSFVCSVGNIPLASLLWSNGISFGGVISFLFADLIIIPLVLIYRKYYGVRTACYTTLVFAISMVGAGIIVDLLFGALGLIPRGARPSSALIQARFAWNYTTWLDLIALVFGSGLVWLHLRSKLSAHDTSPDQSSHHDPARSAPPTGFDAID